MASQCRAGRGSCS